MTTTKSQKILIYRLGSLGDTVMALPCFHQVRNAFPEAEITLLTNRPVASKAAPIEAVLGSHYFYDRIIDYPVGTRNISMLLSLIRQIRALRVDTIINLTASRSRSGTIRDYLFFKAAGIKHLIGFPSAENDYTVEFDPVNGLGEWEAKRLARRISKLGEFSLSDQRHWDLKLTVQEEQTAFKVLSGLSADSQMLTISLGTKNQCNDWELFNWTQLLMRLSVKLDNWKLIVIGAPDERTKAERCLEAWGREGVNLCGTIPPRVSAAVLKQSDLFIGHDSGPIHLAACVGTPSIGIYSARHLPGQWFPKGLHSQILYHLPECAGCGLETCIEQNKKCILSITVDQVEEAVFKMINVKQGLIKAD